MAVIARSIVVLPFANMSSDTEQEYFADGITEELLNLPAQIPELRVISRSATWTFKGEKIDMPTIQKKLSQDHPESIARVYAWTGQIDLAFEWLDKMVDQFGPDKVFEVKTKLYDPIKSDPRGQAFLKEHGAEDRDLSHIVCNPQLSAHSWKPDQLRPANNP